ncbi:retrotransposon-related protein [Tanacetum coccineum]
MAPSTRITSTSNTNTDEGITREYLDAQLAEMRNLITTLGLQQNQVLNNGNGRQANQFSRLAKVEFPKFQGDDVRGWAFKCDQFFLIDNTPAEEKVKIVSVHLSDKALLWHRQFISNNGDNVGWEVYKAAIIQRFGSVFEDPMAALKNAKYEKNAKEYQDVFDTLLCRVTISQEHAISLYLGGLPTELEMSVRMFKPATLADAYSLTNLQEAILEAVKKKNKPMVTSNVSRFGNGSYYGNNNKPALLPLPAPNNPVRSKPNTPVTAPMRKQLTQKEYQDKRAQNLCFYCDQKYTPGHKCSGQLFSLVVLADGEEEGLDWEDHEDLMGVEELPQISLNALNGASNFQTMRVTGKIGNHELHILVDCGSTHNFLDLEVSRKLGCQLKPTCPMAVTVGGGRHLLSNSKCKDFEWQLQGETFVADMMVLPLGGCEMVLGIQWLSTLGDIKCNFKQLKMEFIYNKRRMVLRGTSKASVQWMEGKRQDKEVVSVENAELLMLSVYPNTGPQLLNLQSESATAQIDTALEEVVQNYADVFDIPTELPPRRTHDHKIPLQEGTQPVNIRPYRHPPTQKNAIEAMVKELLEAGVIKHSTSPFASPIVMVKKKDNTWRMCIDYRQLNKHTIKDKFPIPVIEELIDELHGATVFTKLDLRSGYHQIRMVEDDVAKTAFKTHEGHYEFLVMPFGLTNAPSTFQALMNEVFKPFLRKFTLVFFDDILIYSCNLTEHVQHLVAVLDTMRRNQLYAKKSKCVFGTSHVEYLGHVISAEGVATDSNKIKVMQEWPVPTTVKQLRGFLGLTGYYRRFIKNFASISRPLTMLLKKNAFGWNNEAQISFEQLKQAMISAPVLSLPNFDQPFIVETDASGVGLGAVLQQNGHPIAYLSKTLSAKHQALSTYEKEFLAVLLALEKWRGYLLDRHFVIKTDHYSLKYLLDQRITTPTQMKWLPKLMGFDYEVTYKKGSENIAADALSRVQIQGELITMSCSSITTDLVAKIAKTWEEDAALQDIIVKLKQDGRAKKHYQWVNEKLIRKGKLVVGKDEAVRNEILNHFHEGAIGGHSGVKVTTQKLCSLFYWKGLRKQVKNFVRECLVCQRYKPDLAAYPGLLQPLPIPEKVWTSVSMDFIEKLPKSQGKTAILVVVDRLSKYAHFVALSHPFTAVQVAQVFLDTIYKLHGLPQTIVSDRDKVFISTFWRELFKLLQVKLTMSTAYHPQTDGQTEVVNRCLEGYLRCMTGEHPKEWAKWLPLAELWYNTNYHSAINTTPFEVVYGQTPPIHVPYLGGVSKVEAVDRSLKARELAIQVLKFHLKRAQNRMKQHADKGRSERILEVGDWVLLKLQPHRQVTLRRDKQHKFSAKYYGPYKVLEKIGSVAYKLMLPATAQVHDVFHVSQLKKVKGAITNLIPVTPLPQCNNQGQIEVQPMTILDRKMVKHKNAAVV